MIFGFLERAASVKIGEGRGVKAFMKISRSFGSRRKSTGALFCKAIDVDASATRQNYGISNRVTPGRSNLPLKMIRLHRPLAANSSVGSRCVGANPESEPVSYNSERKLPFRRR